MTDIRHQKFAQIVVDYSTAVQPGEKVAIKATTEVVSLVREFYRLILERGAYPHVLLDIPDQEEILFAAAGDELLEFTPLFHKAAFEEFDVLIKIRGEANTRALSNVPMDRLGRYQKMLGGLIATQMRRGAAGALRWMSTLCPTQAYAMEADMGFEEFQDYFYRGCYANAEIADPVAEWRKIQQNQQRYVECFEKGDLVHLRGPNVDLRLSIKGRKFNNACGRRNLPDGEIYTGPVEDSVNGWVRFTYPAVWEGQVASGIELTFEQGKIVKATAEQNQALLLTALNADPGARYLGEFAIGMNYQMNRFTKSILLDEKIGGSFHIAAGAGYPETGSVNQSAIHWDMICDMRQDSEILLDGEVIYRNGAFTF